MTHLPTRQRTVRSHHPGRISACAITRAVLLSILCFFLSVPVWAGTLHSEEFDSTSGGYLAIDVTSWQWGAPGSGPGSAHSPGNCWGTNRSGNYGNNERGALLSPSFDLSAEAGNAIELAWWEWLECEPYYDSATVEVTKDGGATWELVHTVTGLDGNSWQWRRIVLDDSFATDEFRFRFRFESDASSTFSGWYVDDVKLETFAADELLATGLEEGSDPLPELTMTGDWELGAPAGGIGPAAARSPTRCFGTELDALYGRDLTSSLSFAIPVTVDATAEKTICVTWWQYLQLDGFGDRFSVDTSCDGGSTWANALSTDGNALPAQWMAQHLTLTHTFTRDPAEATQYIHFRYRLVSDDAFEQAGMYLDDVAAFEVGSAAVNQPPAFLPDRDAVDLYGEIDDDEADQLHSFDLNLLGDDPEDGALAWSIASAPTHGSTTVTPSGDSAQVTYHPPVNWEGTDVFYVRIADSAGLADTVRIDVEIAIVETVTEDPVDDPPVVANPILDQSMQEDSAPIDIPLTNVFTDPDDDDALIAKQVVGSTNAALIVTSITGDTLRLTLQPDASGSTTITVRGASGGQVVEDEFTVTVSPVNDPPLFVFGDDIELDEDFAGTHTVTASPILPPADEQGQTVTYSLSPAAVGFANVAINSATGEVIVTVAVDGNGEQLFSVIADDGQALHNFAQETFRLTVNAVNDAPTFALDRGTVDLGEDFPGTETVNVVADSVPGDEAAQVVTYSLAPASVAFVDVAINSTTGLVSIIAVADAFGTQEFSVTANDGQAQDRMDSDTFVLTVNALNDPPVAESQDLDALEDTLLDIVLSGTDVENEVLSFSVVDLPDHGSLTGIPPDLTYTPDQDYSGMDSFTFKVNDGTDDSDPGTITIQVGDFDDPAEVASPVGDVTVDEDAAPVQIDVSTVFTDPDEDDSQIVVSVHANTNSALVGTQFDAGTLTLTFAGNRNGTADITLRGVSGWTHADDTFSITVSAVNDPPVNTVAPILQGTAHPGNTVTVSEGTWDDGDDQAPGQISLSYQWQRADDAQGANAADIAGATAPSYTVAAGDTGTWLRARAIGTDDGEGTPVSESVAVFTDWLTVVNSAPAFDGVGATVIVQMDEDSDPTAFGLDLSAADPDGDVLAWSISADPQSGAATLTASGAYYEVDYTPAPDWNGADGFSVHVDDGLGGTDVVTIVIDIAAINDPPAFALDTTAVNLDEDFVGPHTVTIIPAAVPLDEAAQPLTYSVAPANVSFVDLALDPATGEITLNPVPDAYGSTTLTLTADDGQTSGNTYQQILVVNVHPVGDVGAIDVSVDLLATDDTTPALSGQVSVTNATVRVTVDGTAYAATNHGNGTWSLPDNSIAPPLAEGVYDVAASAIDPGNDTGDDATVDELTIDATAPINPRISQTVPGLNVRITDTSVALTWIDGWDNLSGIAGYSLLVDGAADTEPPQTANAAVLPDTITIGPPYGSRWLHIDTVDAAGNWAGAMHYGPWLLGSDDVWVAPGGNDAGPGTEHEPFRTIDEGIEAVTVGYTVHVMAGNYAEQVVIDKALELVGEDRNAVLAGNGWGTGISVTAAGVVISDLSVSGYGTGIEVVANGEAEIRRCGISGNSSFGVCNLNAAARVDARYNWWSDVSGPSGEGPGTGDAVGTNIDYSPWLGNNTGETVVVRPGDDVQDAVDNVESGGTLMLAQGVYTGPLIVDRAVTIAGGAVTIAGAVHVVGSGEVTLSVDFICDTMTITPYTSVSVLDAELTCTEGLQVDQDGTLSVMTGSLTIRGGTVSGTFTVKDSWGTFTITDDTVFASGSTSIFDNSHVSIFNETKHVTVTVAAGADMTIFNGCLIDAVSASAQGLNYHFIVEDGAVFSMTDSTMKHCGSAGTGSQAGLYVDTSNATVQRNTFTGNNIGLVLGPSSGGCDVWHNNFHANAVNARDDSVLATNNWDAGIWGNAWDSVVGWVDGNDDGVGDGVYTIPGAAGVADGFPLLGLTNVFVDDDYAPEAPFYVDSLAEALDAVAANGMVRAYAGLYSDAATATTSGVVLRALETGAVLSGGLVLDTSITLSVETGPAIEFTISGVISGANGLVKTGNGVLTLAGMNTYAGSTTVSTGTLCLGASDVIPDASDLALAGTLDLAGNVETVVVLNGAGTVTNSSAGPGWISVGTGGLSSSFSGVIEDGIGGTALVKVGSGTFALTGGCTYSGTTTVSDGILVVDGSVSASAVTVQNEASLGGAGTTGAVAVESGGQVGPGSSTAVLSTGSIGFAAGATFSIEVDGPVAGTEHDQLDVVGTVSLGDATIVVSPGYLPAPGVEFVVVNNNGADPVVGTFAGLLEGALLLTGGIADFYITYQGGDGNDVVLVTAPPTVVYADDDWAALLPGDDPDGPGPAISFGIDAFATIQDAANGVRDGGSVYVYTGIYSENVNVAKSIVITRASDAQGPILQGVGTGFDVSVPGVVIRYFSCQGFATAISSNSGGTVNYCRFTGATMGVENTGGATIDARHNWWGHVTGPGALGHTGHGSGVSTDVDFRAWWGDPDGTVEYCYHVPIGASIQDAVNSPLVPTGGGIIVDAGAYVGDVTVGKPVFIDAVTTFTVDGDVTFDAEPVLITGAVLADPGTADADDAWHVTTNGQIA
ncbi:MAG: tandem-95 repeat protein, partial [Lentisphaerae bacterium]|nr:tandem-95 repeat protein [Lentisphaerota bacterium]